MSVPKGQSRGRGENQRHNSTSEPLVLPLPRKTAHKIDPRPSDGDHVGLWIDKLLPRNSRDFTLKSRERYDALKRVCGRYRSKLGEEALQRAMRAAAEVHVAYHAFRARLDGRLLVDVGRVNAVETSVSFHPTWGVPRIPGSALKGATRDRMLRDGVARELIERCLGKPATVDSPATAGSLVFHDALPEQGQFTIGLDVLTPHAKAYYEKHATPGDWLSPEPHTLLAVDSPREQPLVFVFLVGVDTFPNDGRTADGLEPQAREDLRVAVKALKDLLLEDGIGAKTVAGYGRFRLLKDVR